MSVRYYVSGVPTLIGCKVRSSLAVKAKLMNIRLIEVSKKS